MMEYKGYIGKVEFDDEAGIFHGEVLGTRDVITFQGRSVDELKTALQESIDDYLAFCKQRGQEPDKPFSGQFVTRGSARASSPDQLGGQHFRKEPECLGCGTAPGRRRPGWAHQAGQRNEYIEEKVEGHGKAEVETARATRLILPAILLISATAGRGPSAGDHSSSFPCPFLRAACQRPRVSCGPGCPIGRPYPRSLRSFPALLGLTA